MRKFIALLIGWILALAGFLFLNISLNQPSSSFWGLVRSEKAVIRAPEAGEIQVLKVLPGDAVLPGDTLLLLFRPEIGRQQQEGEFQKERLRLEYGRELAETQSDILTLRAERQAKLDQIGREMTLWEARQTRDKAMASTWLEGESVPHLIDSIAALKSNEFIQEQKSINETYDLRLQALRNRMNLSQPALKAEQALIENELNYWETVKDQQVIRATEAGWVGEVLVSESEQVLKGTSLVEIWGNEAQYVEGYIHENFTAEIKSGQQVLVSSSNNTDQTANATIVKLGNRIVEFPDRLRKAPDVRLWGREAIIKIDPGNPFLIGEKVIIQVP